MRTTWLVFAMLAVTLAGARAANANGAFPLAGQLVVSPEDPDQLVMRGTFGLVVSRDGGQSWDWLCETGMGYENMEPPIALLGSGSLLLAVPGGISRSDPTWCDFAPATGIAANVVDVSVERGTPGAALAISFDLGTMSSALWGSSDDGQSWARLETFDDFQATTVDVAASDSDRIYVSGRTVPNGPGTVLRSDDHGQSWTAHDVPALIPSQPYIAAVQPEDPDTFYLRRNGIPGTLWVTRDGGQSFEMILKLNGPLKAFALSPDGEQLLAGNMGDGLHRADAESLVFERVACDGVQCLSWTESGLFSCGDLIVNRYLVGKSTDRGETFDSTLWPSCVPGPRQCAATTSIGGCGDDWAMVQMQLNTSECIDDPSTGPKNLACFATAGAGASGGSADGRGGAGVDGGAASQPAAADEEELEPGGGGFCALGFGGAEAWPWALAALAAFRLGRRCSISRQAPRRRPAKL